MSRAQGFSSPRLRGGAAVLLLLAVGLCRPAAAASCLEQLGAEAGQWVDPATPADACTTTLPGAGAAMQLVFSDEFNAPGRSLAAGAGDERWTADNLWYAGTDDMEVYVPSQVTTQGGAAVITMEQGQAAGLNQRPSGEVWNVTKDFKSGFFSSWNKFCFTGGYVEAALQFPGDDYISGFWPAFWLMGNLGRPGYMATTGGMWPYTYNSCGGGDVGAERKGANQPQRITACHDPPAFDRAAYGLRPGQGRGAPEIDIVEMKVPPSVDKETGEQVPLGLPRGGKPGQHSKAFNSMTLQLGPLLPNGTTWMDPANSKQAQGPLGPGMQLPQQGLPPGMWTHATFWRGEYADGMMPQLQALGNEQLIDTIRPGNLVQDSISVMATIDSSYFNSYHKFGLDWQPGEHVRWYIDGVLVYEITKEALRAQGNGTYNTAERLIPLEPMFLIFNFALSNSFTTVDLDRLQFPAQYKIDYVRVWQDPGARNVGCSPRDFPTEQYLACNRDLYVVTEQDQALIPQACAALPSCRAQAGYERQGGRLYKGADQPWEVQNVATPQECCKLCGATPECGAFNWNPYFSNTCALLAPSGWELKKMAKDYEGIITGVILDAGSLVPRGDSKPTPSPPSPPAPVGPRPPTPTPPPSSARAARAAGWAAACAAIAALLLLL